MRLAKVPAFSLVSVVDFGSIDDDDIRLGNGIDDVVPVWTHCEDSDDPFATVRVRGVVDAHQGLVWLAEDAKVEVVAEPRFAGMPEDLIKEAQKLPKPKGAQGSFQTEEGWPDLIWQSDLVFSPVAGWQDPELAVEVLLCALAVAPAQDPMLRPTLLAALKARYKRLRKSRETYPPKAYPWRDGAPPSKSLLKYLRG